MGCLPSVPVSVKFGKAAPTSSADVDPDLAMHSLREAIPAALSETGGGSARSIAGGLFPSNVERDEFIKSAYMTLQGNDEFVIRSYTIILSYPRADGPEGYHGALRAVDKNHKVARSIKSQQYGLTLESAFAALVDWIERLSGQMLSHPSICVTGSIRLRTIAHTHDATKPQIIESLWTQQPSRGHHPNPALARDGVIQNARPRDVTRTRPQGRYYPSGQPPTGQYPGGHYPAVERNSSMDAFLHYAPLDDDGNREIMSSGAYAEFRPFVKRHSSSKGLLQPAAAHGSFGSHKLSAAGRCMSSRSMYNVQNRPLTLMEEADIRRSVSYGNMLRRARKSYPVSGYHHLYYENDGSCPPIAYPPPVLDPSVVTFQGLEHRKHKLYMTGLPRSGSLPAHWRSKSSEMIQLQRRSGIQHAFMTGGAGDVHSDHHPRPSYQHDKAASGARNSIASNRFEHYPEEQAVTSGSKALPARYHRRNADVIMPKQAITKPQSRQYRSTEAIITRASMVSLQPSSQHDNRVMVSEIPDSPLSPGTIQEPGFVLSGSPSSLVPSVPRIVRHPSPVRSDFGGIKPLKCTRKAADRTGRPVARIESMRSLVLHDAASHISGEAKKPLVRLPPVDDHRPLDCEASG